MMITNSMIKGVLGLMVGATLAVSARGETDNTDWQQKAMAAAKAAIPQAQKDPGPARISGQSR
jgi:hypothetical protein